MTTTTSPPASSAVLVYPWHVAALAGDGTPADAVTITLPSGLYVMTGYMRLMSSGSDLTDGGLTLDGSGAWTPIAGGIDLLPLLGSTATDTRLGGSAVVEVDGGTVAVSTFANTTVPADTVDSRGAFTFAAAVDRS